MAEVAGIAVSSVQVAGFGFGLSNNLHGHFELVPDADGQITDLAKNVELTSRVFEEASRVFDDAEIKAVQNGDTVRVAQMLIGACHGIFEKIERILDEGRKNELPRPFKVHEIGLLHADLEMNKSTMQLLLSALEVARQRISEDLSALGEETSFQEMEELIPVVEESVRRYERLRAKSILEDGTSTPVPSDGGSFVPDPTGSTEFTYIDDSPPSPGLPAVQVLPFSASNDSASAEIQVHVSRADDLTPTTLRTSLVDLKPCIEKMRAVLHQIENLEVSGDGADVMSRSDAQDLMDTCARTREVLAQFLSRKKVQKKLRASFRPKSSKGSHGASPESGSSYTPSSGRLKRWSANIGRRVAQEVKPVNEWMALSLTRLDLHLQQDVHLRLGVGQKRKPPIEFEDILGRKFSFPWKLCSTWKGMEDLIKQAFVSDARVCQSVYRGFYDLVGPDGLVILPLLWASTVQPGWTITMRMPQMDYPALDAPQPPVPSITPEAPWLDFSVGRGRSLKRRSSSTSPVIIDVGEGPAGIQILPRGVSGTGRPRPVKTRSAPDGLLWTVGKRGKESESLPEAAWIDVSPLPRARGRAPSRDRNSVPPVPPPPPPPPPPPFIVDVGGRPKSIYVLPRSSFASDSDGECLVEDVDEPHGASFDLRDVPSTAEEALRRWTNIFN